MAEKLVTVFGGSGFLGRHLICQMAKEGVRIRVACRNPNLANFLLPMGDVGQIQIVAANLRNEPSISRALDGASAVVNLVGVLAETRRQKFTDLHQTGAALIARHAAVKKIDQLVHVSSIGADENAPSRYLASKGAGEAAVREEFPNATIVRPSIVFGPEDEFFNRFAAMMRYTPIVPLINKGQTKLQPVFVGDVAQGICAVLAGETTQKILEFGGPAAYTFRELMDLIQKETGRSSPYINLPAGLAKFSGFFLQLLPSPLLTVDQVRTLHVDNVVAEASPDAAVGVFSDLGIEPQPVEAIVGQYLWRFRPHGQYEASRIG